MANASAATRRKEVASGSGYRFSGPIAACLIASTTGRGGGYGDSLVFNLMNLPGGGCSPGAYANILASAGRKSEGCDTSYISSEVLGSPWSAV